MNSIFSLVFHLRSKQSWSKFDWPPVPISKYNTGMLHSTNAGFELDLEVVKLWRRVDLGQHRDGRRRRYARVCPVTLVGIGRLAFSIRESKFKNCALLHLRLSQGKYSQVVFAPGTLHWFPWFIPQSKQKSLPASGLPVESFHLHS